MYSKLRKDTRLEITIALQWPNDTSGGIRGNTPTNAELWVSRGSGSGGPRVRWPCQLVEEEVEGGKSLC